MISKGVLEVVKTFIASKLTKILVISGTIICFLSFFEVEYSDSSLRKIDFDGTPKGFVFAFGAMLFFAGMYVHLRESPRSRVSRLIKKINNGFEIPVGDSALRIVFDRIENIDSDDPQTAVVLPVNDSFDKECFEDTQSSAGAFMQRHYAKGVSNSCIEKLVNAQLSNSQYKSQEEGGVRTFPIGTTIYLDSPMGTSRRIILTSVTTRRKGEGIRSDPSYVAKCVLEILKLSADKKVTKLYMPVLGAGHGGLDFKVALSILLLEFIYNLKYKKFHHIKELAIVIPEAKYREDVRNALVDINALL